MASQPVRLTEEDARPAITAESRYTAQQRTALLLLTLSYACAHLDRNIVTILLAPIKTEFGVSDTALGLLTGLTFAVFYGVMGIPLAYLADRASRRHLLGASLALFSVFTAFSGMVSSFAQLVTARIGVGIGEGGAVPAAQSIIGDMFRPEQRFFAVGIYSTGASIGALLGLVIGGLVSQRYDWRFAFLVAGLVSLAVALANWLLIREPARQTTSTVSEAASASEADDSEERVPGMWEAARYLWVERPAYRHLFAAAGIAAMPGFSLLVWTPSLFSRHFHMPQAEIGLWLGLLFGCGGAVGILASSWLSSRLARRSIALSLVPPIAGCCLVGLFSVLMAFATTPSAALLLLLIPAIGYGCHLAPLYGVVHAIIQSRVRARAIAFLLLAANIAGFGLGPLVVGVVSDTLAGATGGSSLNYALLVVDFGWFWAAAHLWAAMRLIRKEVEIS
jgi:predicted MFS family arabinose efflux permease